MNFTTAETQLGSQLADKFSWSGIYLWPFVRNAIQLNLRVAILSSDQFSSMFHTRGQLAAIRPVTNLGIGQIGHSLGLRTLTIPRNSFL